MPKPNKSKVPEIRTRGVFFLRIGDAARVLGCSLEDIEALIKARKLRTLCLSLDPSKPDYRIPITSLLRYFLKHRPGLLNVEQAADFLSTNTSTIENLIERRALIGASVSNSLERKRNWGMMRVTRPHLAEFIKGRVSK